MHRSAHALSSGSWRSDCPTKYLRLRRVRKRGRGRTKISGRFGYSETVTFTVRVGHNSRQGAGGDNRLCKGTTTSKGLVETTGCGRAQRSERFRRRQGCGRAQRPARCWWRQLVVEGHNGLKGSGGDNWLWKGTTVGKGSTEAVGKGPAEEVLYGNSRQGSGARSPIRQQSARVRRKKKSYTATVGKGPAEEVLHGNSRQRSGGSPTTATVGKGSTGRSPTRQQLTRVRQKKSNTSTVGKGPTEEVLYGNGRQEFDGKKS